MAVSLLQTLSNRLKHGLEKSIKNFLIWRHKHMSERQFVLLLSIIVGFSSGVVAVVLKNMVHLIQQVLKADVLFASKNFHYFIYPVIGLFITFLLVNYLFKRRVGHGIPSALYAISKNNSKLPIFSTYSTILTSMFTVGFGGSVGLEGPTVGASSAIGSNIAQKARVNYKITTLMLGCGAAGAMSGIFNAPIAAIVFALEVIMLDLTSASLIPLLMASVSAALTSAFMYGDDLLFNIPVSEEFVLSEVPFCILLGILTGLVSVYFSKIYWLVEGKFEVIQSAKKRLFVGALILGSLLFVFPPLYGEGFGIINELLSGNSHNLIKGTFFESNESSWWILIVFLICLGLLKVIATAVTFGAGGVGGVFAPSLFVGSIFGFSFAKIINALNWLQLSEKNFTLVGMGGVIAGILHAPLTGLFLIAEITGGYDLIIPLMLTAAISYLTSRYFNPHSLYNMQLAKRGELITHDKDKAVLTLMNLHAEVEKDFSCVYPEDSLRQLVKTVSYSRRNLFPVIDQQGCLKGIVLLDDIRQLMFDQSKYDELLVKDVMSDFPTAVSSEDSMDVVMNKFNQTGAWNLPVIDNNLYVGFVSKSKLFSAYRKILKNFSDE